VAADRDCQADLMIDDIDCGSYDPDGDPITLTLNPPGPYPIGTLTVELIVSDDKNTTDVNFTNITVVETAYCDKKQAIDYLKNSLGEDSDIMWASPDRIVPLPGIDPAMGVFEFEQKVCFLLDVFNQNTNSIHAAEIDEVMRLMVKADKKLADIAISDAIFLGCDTNLITEAKKLRHDGNMIDAAGGQGVCEMILLKYTQAYQKVLTCLFPYYSVDGEEDL
jgi:hypothetical protein